MIIVTGGLGFIGSNIIKKLNELGYFNIVIVDSFSNGKLIENVNDTTVSDYVNSEEVLEFLTANQKKIEVIFHQGAISDTTCWDAKLIMANNYSFSKKLVNFCSKRGIKFIYASSASVYGSGDVFKESPKYEMPINLYAYSKLLFDQYVRNSGLLDNTDCNITGLRYFNVYGPREKLKGNMSSPVFKLANQIITEGEGTLFGGYLNYGPGEQRRDFVYVDDVVDVNLFFWKNNIKSGIFNVGTGSSSTFNQLSLAVLNELRKLGVKKGKIKYVDFPENLKGFYQSFTEADINKLKKVGYNKDFIGIEEGVHRYLKENKSGLNL